MYLVVKESHGLTYNDVRYRDVTSTGDDAEAEMIRDMGHELDFREWDHIVAGQETIILWVDCDLLDIHVSWFTVNIGEHGWAVVKTIVLNGGFVSTECVRSVDGSYDDGARAVAEEYEEEIGNPTAGVVWDIGLCKCCGNHALLSTEDKRTIVDIRLVDTNQTYVGRSFKYAG